MGRLDGWMTVPKLDEEDCTSRTTEISLDFYWFQERCKDFMVFREGKMMNFHPDFTSWQSI